ncbi:hypothetical protein [Magnetospirillum sp. UT-4]|uniref:hypothetical protein n=1 Tax=Magnetospirillum sp. UT-4 TaxID=2681467 RepID=UPI001574C9E6|nr:hypothetical protein [Magnetospirillum sp. UT-4]
MSGLRGVPTFPRFERQERRQSLNAGPNLAAIGAMQGPGAPLAELLRRVGQGVIDESLADRARAAEREATAGGLQAGRDAGALAAASMAEERDGPLPSLKLREDDTLTAHAFNKAMLAAYVSRLDLAMEERAAQYAAEHPDDPRAFLAKWQGTSEGIISTMPPEVQMGVEVELRQKGMRYLHPIQRAANERVLYGVNADLIRSSEEYAARAASAYRAGDNEGGSEWAKKFLGVVATRTDLTPEQRDKVARAFNEDRRNQTALGMFERELAVSPDKAMRFVEDLTHPDAHPDWHPSDREKLGRHMTAILHDRESGLDRQRRERERAAEEGRSRWLSDFEISLHRGERTYRDIEAAYQAGLLKDRERTHARPARQDRLGLCPAPGGRDRRKATGGVGQADARRSARRGGGGRTPRHGGIARRSMPSGRRWSRMWIGSSPRPVRTSRCG